MRPPIAVLRAFSHSTRVVSHIIVLALVAFHIELLDSPHFIAGERHSGGPVPVHRVRLVIDSIECPRIHLPGGDAHIDVDTTVLVHEAHEFCVRQTFRGEIVPFSPAW